MANEGAPWMLEQLSRACPSLPLLWLHMYVCIFGVMVFTHLPSPVTVILVSSKETKQKNNNKATKQKKAQQKTTEM